MKKVIRITAVALLVVMLTLALASCAKTISGSYKGVLGNTSIIGTEVVYTFSGNKVTIESTSGVAGFEKTTEFEGTYEIFTEEDVEYIKFTFEDDDADSYNTKVTFEETEDGIKLGGIEYKKQ